MKPAFALLLTSFLAGAGATYTISDNVVGSKFFDFFEFEAIPDPTNGRVNYVNETVARSQHLAYAQGPHGSFTLRADSKTVLDPNGPGRNSWRIKSKKTYTTHVAIFDIIHMPEGCGTWPGIREKNEAKGNGGGLIDMLEGVNNLEPNLATLHTNPGCTMPAERNQTGTNQNLDCNQLLSDSSGCGVSFPSSGSYGPSMNQNGGAIYAIERTPTYIKIFFWTRYGNIPVDVREGASIIDTDRWGTPVAYFPDTSCNMADHFIDHNILISMTFCGGWAGGSAYEQAGCPSTCVDFVNNNPQAFTNAYFEFGSIRVYQ
ncbi:hypothetical protein D9756_009217 [Leucocoprinus leucothites]|uniref:Glycoside hydrolase family 16 protein n=1 Tax=Leucocoprinus leucothites TaxID=201217 RepID=A0A8H5CY05_9AGAR|nr:hypothetical protein D9756_009217 [Leucoagaricus leucothites]